MEPSVSYKISGDADWKIFDLVVDLLARELKSSWIVKLDGVEQRYWDLKVGEETITLHLEHLLGIFLLADQSSAGLFSRVRQILIKNNFK